MIQSLKSNEIDVGIGLTEGWVGGLAKDGPKPIYKIYGTYVESPLRWAISTGAKRNDITEVQGPGGLEGKKVGISRIGSGSYIMPFVLADNNGWLQPGKQPFENVILNDFKNLRAAVNDGRADFFMWEHFTTKRYYDNGELKKIGEIYTPWSSWKIVTRWHFENNTIDDMAKSINKGIKYFSRHKDEAIKYISTNLDYSEADAREWIKTVEFADEVRGVDPAVVQKTVDVLGKAGVLDPEKADLESIIGVWRRPGEKQL